MRHLRKYLGFGVVLALFSLLVVPIMAQDEGGQGGIIVEGNLGGDPATFNPIVTNDTSSQQVATFLFPTLVGIDPQSTIFTPGAAGSIAI